MKSLLHIKSAFEVLGTHLMLRVTRTVSRLVEELVNSPCSQAQKQVSKQYIYDFYIYVFSRESVKRKVL